MTIRAGQVAAEFSCTVTLQGPAGSRESTVVRTKWKTNRAERRGRPDRTRAGLPSEKPIAKSTGEDEVGREYWCLWRAEGVG